MKLNGGIILWKQVMYLQWSGIVKRKKLDLNYNKLLINKKVDYAHSVIRAIVADKVLHALHWRQQRRS